ncbi:MAG: DUF4595 domain-containing protein [Bacteroidota bacterium]
MTNFFRTPLYFFLCFFLFASCSKSKEEGIPENTCDYVKSWAVLDYAGKPVNLTYFTYDKNGKVTSIKSDGQNKTTFSYSKNSITVDAVEFDGRQSKAIYNLDGNGHVISSSIYNFNCKYDAEGFLISFDRPGTDPNGGVTYVNMRLSYKDGNLVKITAPEPYYSGQVSDITYDNKPAQSCSGLNTPLKLTGLLGRDEAVLVHAGFFGKASKNLVKQITFTTYGYPTEMISSFDAKGRVTSMNGVVYTYQCD